MIIDIDPFYSTWSVQIGHRKLDKIRKTGVKMVDGYVSVLIITFQLCI